MRGCLKSLRLADAHENARTHARVLFLVPLLPRPYIPGVGARALLRTALITRFSNLPCRRPSFFRYMAVPITCTFENVSSCAVWLSSHVDNALFFFQLVNMLRNVGEHIDAIPVRVCFVIRAYGTPNTPSFATRFLSTN